MDALIQPIREGLENWDIPLDWQTAPRPAPLTWTDVQRALEQRRQAQYTDMVRDLPVLIDDSVQAVHTSTGEEQRGLGAVRSVDGGDGGFPALWQD